MTDDPYVVLEVHRGADDREITAAYERRITGAIRAGHLETAKRVDAAYELLRNPHRRAMFDRYGIVDDVARPHPSQRFAPPAPVAWRTWTPAQPPAPTPRRRPARPVGHVRGWRGALTSLLVAAIVIGVMQRGLLRHAEAVSLGSDSWGTNPVSTGNAPPAHFTLHPKRLLPTVTPPAGVGGYTVMNTSAAGQPIRFDPCRSIRYVVSGAEAFPGADAMLTSAITAASTASGLQFVYGGTTAELATTHRSPYQPQTYGNRWAPVLVAWTDPQAVPQLAGDVVGLGGASDAMLEGSPRSVSGIVYLDAPALAAMMQRPDGAAAARTVMLHELGHLLGLGHTADPTDVMDPTDHPLAGYSAGDLRGLALAGSGSCSHYG